MLGFRFYKQVMNIHDSIEKLVPYRPGRPIDSVKKEFGLSEVIKLASNENPLGMSPKAHLAMTQALSALHLYPDPTAFELVEKLAQSLQVKPDEIALGNGSDELFDQLIRIFCNPGDQILVSKGAFSAYPISAQAARVGVVQTDLRPSDYQIDLNAFSQVLVQDRQHQGLIKIVFIPNINNPTGLCLPSQELESFLAQWSQDPNLLIVLDEAYHEFVRQADYRSGLDLRKTYPHLITSRTFSKTYGMAGLRLGFIVAPVKVVDYINRIRKPFNINTLAQAAAKAALDDHEFVSQTCQLTWSELDRVQSELHQFGLKFLTSQGNFVMFDTQRDVKKVEAYFLSRGVIIRPVDNYGFTTWVRLSIGLPRENTRALEVLSQMLKDLN